MPDPLADLRTLLPAIEALAREVGARVLGEAAALRARTDDKAGVDVVTAADRLSEELLVAGLERLCPGHRINAEEGTRRGPADSPWCWHVDPLDGTANFSRACPWWTISLGLSLGDRPVLGVVHAPEDGWLVSAIPGLGAWRDGAPLPAATPAGPERSWIVATDWPWALDQRPRVVRLAAELSPRIRALRTWGSAAAELCQLAQGRLDAYAIPHIFTWDQCGGAAVCAALGYDLRTWDGTPWDLSRRDLVACRPGMWPGLAAACGA